MSKLNCCNEPSVCQRTGLCSVRESYRQAARNTDPSPFYEEPWVSPVDEDLLFEKAFAAATSAIKPSNQSSINSATHSDEMVGYEMVGYEPVDVSGGLSMPPNPNAAWTGDIMPTNPKQKYGDVKVPLHLFPTTAVALGSMAFLEGREKYGQDNFRGAPIEAMTYLRAAMSHLNLYREGEWTPNDSPEPSMRDSFVPHLGLALACISIIIDAHYAGTLIDNRNYPGGYQKAIAEMQPLVQKIKDSHSDKNPKHYSLLNAKEKTNG